VSGILERHYLGADRRIAESAIRKYEKLEYASQTLENVLRTAA
jgi:hypothetical protein